VKSVKKPPVVDKSLSSYFISWNLTLFAKALKRLNTATSKCKVPKKFDYYRDEWPFADLSPRRDVSKPLTATQPGHLSVGRTDKYWRWSRARNGKFCVQQLVSVTKTVKILQCFRKCLQQLKKRKKSIFFWFWNKNVRNVKNVKYAGMVLQAT